MSVTARLAAGIVSAMAHTPPTLDYAARPRHMRLRKWTRRTLLAILLLACLYATPLAWLYWGWRQEQPAREMDIARYRAADMAAEPVGPAFMDKLIPARLAFIRERITGFDLTGYEKAPPDDLRVLDGLHELKWLKITGPVTDAELVHLEGLGRLQELFLCGHKLTDGALIHMKKLRGLKLLYLEGSQITDAGMVHLQGLTGLQYLVVTDTQVTAKGVADLQKALPQCNITR